METNIAVVVLQGVDLTVPVDNSMQECYGGRESCVNKSFPGEVGYYLLQLTIVMETNIGSSPIDMMVRCIRSRFFGSKIYFLSHFDCGSLLGIDR